MLIDHGISTNVLFYSVFQRLQLNRDNIKVFIGCLDGLSREKVQVKGLIMLEMESDLESNAKTIKMKYLVVDSLSSYNPSL